FRAVMITGSMTAASELMGITQPAVSRLIRDFELAVAMALFERRGNQIAPTPEAVSLFTEVERSFVGLSRIADHAAAIRSQQAGSLRIAALPALAMGVLPRFVGQFLRERSNIHVSVHGIPSHLVVEAVAAGQADVGYAVGPLERPGFLLRSIGTPAVVIMPEHHRLAGLRVVRPQDLAGEQIVGVAAETLFRSRLDAALGDIPRSVLVETPLSQIACVLVSEGIGIGIVDPFSASEFVGRGLVARPLRPEVDVGMLLLVPRQRAMSALARSFTAGFAAHLDRLRTEVIAGR
ncbi:MAG TPA: LysR family transcriptional regulator, partial [Microvirga sp.]|nr:LysR family transcriptional regulator [Microvirga sp.]